MKKIAVYIILIVFFLSGNAVAQNTNVKNTSTTTGKPSANTQISNSSDSLKKAVANLKALFGGKRDTITVVITDVDFDDSDLTNFKECVKTTKGVKSLTMQYKSGNATLAFSYKGKSSELWDNLPPPAKKPFKLVEINDYDIALKLRTPK